MEEESRCKLSMKVTTELNDTYELNIDESLWPKVGHDFPDMMARAVNDFMRVIGYSRFNKDMVFLESVTEDEYNYLFDCLDEYRKQEQTNGE